MTRDNNVGHQKHIPFHLAPYPRATERLLVMRAPPLKKKEKKKWRESNARFTLTSSQIAHRSLARGGEGENYAALPSFTPRAFAIPRPDNARARVVEDRTVNHGAGRVFLLSTKGDAWAFNFLLPRASADASAPRWKS